MDDINSRNFNILKDRLSGLSVAEVAAKYGLSTASVYNVIRAQLAKVAEHDSEFERRLSKLRELLESSEQNAKFLAGQLKPQEDEKNRLRALFKTKQKELARSRSEIEELKTELRSLQYRLDNLEALREEDRARINREQFSKVKKNITLFRDPK